MSAPSITPSQSFNATYGSYFEAAIDYTGTSPITWKAVGLPNGITLDPDTGTFNGITFATGHAFCYVVATNSEGSSASVIVLKISVPDTSSFGFSIYPKKGYSEITPYSFSSSIPASLSAYDVLWKFGDGGSSSELNPTHIYALPGSYTVSLNAYTPTGTHNVSVVNTVQLLINESIYFEQVPPPTFAGHLNRYPFKINITSSTTDAHVIDLAAQFSRSYETQNPHNKWSFLRPEWRFLDLDGKPITQIQTKDDVMYANEFGLITHNATGFVVGVTGTASFYFVDDIYNFDLAVSNQPYTTILATLRTSAVKSFNDNNNVYNQLPSFSNSLATVNCPHIFLWRQPDTLNILENGKRGYLNPRWSEAPQPILVNTSFDGAYPDYWVDGNGVKVINPAYAFCHYLPMKSDPITLNLGATGLSANFIPYNPSFSWLDVNYPYQNIKSPGYYKGTFFTNTSSTLNAVLTASLSYVTPSVSAQYFNPMLWISNPEAGMMSVAQYVYSTAFTTISTENQNIAILNNFEMPVITQPDFTNQAMALSGFHGINSIAALPLPSYNAWVADSELNYVYRLNTIGQILCAIDINQVVADNNLGFLVPNQVSPVSIVLDSKKDFWVTLHDTVSTLKFDSYGNFLFAVNPLSVTDYLLPPSINYNWYEQNTYYEDYLANPIDLNFIEPTGIDTDSNDNVWVTYSNYASGYLIKYDTNGQLLHSFSFPVCSCPQQIVVDNQDNIWIALSDNIWRTNQSSLEKRNSSGVLLSSIQNIFGVNHLALDPNQNVWFTHSYHWVGYVDNTTATLGTYDIGGTNHADWFDTDINTDETALEGIGFDSLGRMFIINSYENQVYVFNNLSDVQNNILANKFHINPRGFEFYMEGQYEPTTVQSSLWSKSAQATGDWTGFRWINKYGKNDPYYNMNSSICGLSGTSVYLDFISHENFDSFKHNENFDLAAKMQSLAFMPSLNDSTNLFVSFLGSIYGKYPFNHTDLGVTSYEKIANFVANHSDIDYCNINQMYNLAASMGIDLEDYRLNFPEAVQKIVDLTSINQSKLFGALSMDQTAFTKPNSKGILNRGDLITLNYTVTAGVPVVLKDRTINNYRLIETGEINGLSTYPLSTLAEWIGIADVDWTSYYEFYKFVPSYDGTQLEGMIDWNNPQTTLSRSLSTQNDWFKDNGFLDAQISYELYKGLGFIN